MPTLSYEQAYQINEWIDKIHSPQYWALGGVIAIIAIVESYLPHKKSFASDLDQYLVYFKLFFLVAFSLVFFTQGLLGGCIVQIPQNWIAQKYLDREFWYPFGLVYRESLNSKFWPLLRLFYLVLGSLAFWRTWVFYQKFAKFTDPTNTFSFSEKIASFKQSKKFKI
jgi:hypothetical protein